MLKKNLTAARCFLFYLIAAVFFFTPLVAGSVPVSLSPAPIFRALDANGRPLAGGKLYTYAAGTTTPLATYTDSTGTSANTNPVILDAQGQANVWLGNNTYKLLLKDADGVTQAGYPVDNISRYSTISELSATNTSLSVFQSNLLSNSYSSSTGTSLIGYTYNSSSPGRLLSSALRDKVSVKDFGAICDGSSHLLSSIYTTLLAAQAVYPFVTNLSWELDHAAIQSAINTGKMAYIPRGICLVDAIYGITFNSGNSLIGDGFLNSVILAKKTGGTLSQLQNYLQGSIIKRKFTLGVSNDYVNGIYLSNFAVIMNPEQPIRVISGSYSPTYIQIGIDLRHITRSRVENVYVGNLTMPGSIYTGLASNTDSIQGYAYAFGTQSGSSIDYAGGEGNEIENSFGWGAFKAFTIDDSQLMSLSGGSSAHGTRILNCDSQGAHNDISQESQYTAGFSVKGGIHQYTLRQSGNSNPTYILGLTGYNNNAQIDYIECGTACDYVLSMGSLSKNNIIELPYWDNSTVGGNGITDAGTNNLIKTFSSVNNGAGGIFTKGGEYVEYWNQGYRKLYASFFWNGSSVTVNKKSSGVGSISRNSTGNYTINFSNNMTDAYWVPSIVLNTDGSGHGALVNVTSKGAGSITFVTYIQNGGTTTQIDPLEINFSGIQN